MGAVPMQRAVNGGGRRLCTLSGGEFHVKQRRPGESQDAARGQGVASGRTGRSSPRSRSSPRCHAKQLPPRPQEGSGFRLRGTRQLRAGVAFGQHGALHSVAHGLSTLPARNAPSLRTASKDPRRVVVRCGGAPDGPCWVVCSGLPVGLYSPGRFASRLPFPAGAPPGQPQDRPQWVPYSPRSALQ